jgi:penicillin-binding protein 2
VKLKLLLVIFFSVWIILISRIYLVSVTSNEYYSELAQKNTIKKEPLLPTRGVIYDRNGIALAVNKLGFSISLKPHLSYKKRRKTLEKYLKAIQKSLNFLIYNKLLKEYIKKDSPYNHDFIKIVDFIPYEKMLPHFTKLTQYDSIKISPTTLRYYPFGRVASHIIGYVSKSNAKNGIKKVIGVEGKAGIEKYYNTKLQGILGERIFQVTAKNEEIAELKRVPPSQNQDLILNIDIKIQKLLTKLFSKIEGAAIVMDANDGSIIAAGSYPEYDINKFVTGITQKEWKELNNDLRHPFLNKLVNSLYPPGSIIKPTIALAFFNSGQINPRTTYYCNGTFLFGNRNFRCWKSSGHGNVRARKAIRESCDIYFYKGSYSVGIDKISQKLKEFGFGVKTGIDLPNEFIGIVPNKEWKIRRFSRPWYIGETFITSIGQGSFLTTPMQIARNTALLASSKLVTPHIAKTIASKEINVSTKLDIYTQIDKRYIKIIRQAMADVVNTPFGTGVRYIQTPLLIAGKTGTAQVVGISQEVKERVKERDMQYYKRSHAYMTTFAPFKNPRYVVSVMVEHGGHGGHAAGPIVTEIYNKMIELGYFD